MALMICARKDGGSGYFCGLGDRQWVFRSPEERGSGCGLRLGSLSKIASGRDMFVSWYVLFVTKNILLVCFFNRSFLLTHFSKGNLESRCRPPPPPLQHMNSWPYHRLASWKLRVEKGWPLCMSSMLKLYKYDSFLLPSCVACFCLSF